MFLVILILLSLTQLNIGLDFEIGRKETCNELRMITAIMENLEDRRLAYLFSGQNVWTINITDAAVVKVEKIQDEFENATGIVESAGKMPFFNEYLLLTQEKGFVVKAEGTEPHDYKKFMDELVKRLSLDAGTKEIVCTASFPVSSSEIHILFVFKDGSIFICYRAISDLLGPSKRPCEDLSKELKNPNHVDPYILKDCEGLMFDDGLSPFNEFSQRQRRDEVDNNRYRMLFANKETLRHWDGERLMYDLKLTKVFGCKFSFLFYVMLAIVVGAVVASITAAVLILIFVKRGKKVDLEESVTLDKKTQATRTSFAVKSIARFGSETKGLNSKRLGN